MAYQLTRTHPDSSKIYGTGGFESTRTLVPGGGSDPYDPYKHEPAGYRYNYPTPAKSSKRLWGILGGAALALVIIAAIVTGIVVSNNSKRSNNNNTVSTNGTKSSTSGDPSVFTKDPNLHQAFYGMAYTPDGSQLPNCGSTLDGVIKDIQIMSQLTTRIRLYGADCNQSALVLEAIKQTKVNMTVWLGNYPIATDNNTAYQRQRGELQDALQTYGTDHVGGMTVGNEFMLNYLNANGATNANSAVGNTGAQMLIADIQNTRNMLGNMSLSKTLPVGNADAGSYFNTMVLEAVDYGMANVHPWFANVSETDAAAWTASFFQNTDVSAANALSNKPQMYIAETGWPTQSADAGNAKNGPGTASVAGLQTFLDTFVCQANNNGTGYFFFEFADEPWKGAQFGGVEGYWGLFNYNRTLKNINIPTCISP